MQEVGCKTIATVLVHITAQLVQFRTIVIALVLAFAQTGDLGIYLMKVFYTVYNDFPYAASVYKEDDSVVLDFTDVNGSHRIIKYNASNFHTQFGTGEKEKADCLTWYLSVDENNNLHCLNKYAETMATKNNGFVYSRQSGVTTLAQVYIPYANAALEDWSVRVTTNTALTEANGFDFVNTNYDATVLANFEAITLQSLPSLRVANKITNQDGTFSVVVQLTLNGQDVQRSGVRILAKSDSGYIAIRDQNTDQNGQVTFTCRRLDLSDSDEMIAEFGFKYKTNVANCSI